MATNFPIGCWGRPFIVGWHLLSTSHIGQSSRFFRVAPLKRLPRVSRMSYSDWDTTPQTVSLERRSLGRLHRRRGHSEIFSSGVALLLAFLLIAVWAISVGS